MKARSAECRTASPKSPDEIYKEKNGAWNASPESRVFMLNSEQMAKLTNKEFEIILTIGNREYPKRGKK